MKNLIFIIAFLFVCVEASADTAIYFRKDGGTIQECDGTKPLPKSPDKHCAFKRSLLMMKASAASQDVLNMLPDGDLKITVEFISAPTKITFSDFKSNFFIYSDQTILGGNFIVRRPQAGKPTQLFAYSYLGRELDSVDFKNQMAYYTDNTALGSPYVIRRYQYGKPTTMFKMEYIGKE